MQTTIISLALFLLSSEVASRRSSSHSIRHNHEPIISSNSKVGRNLLSKARRLDENDNDVDYSWMTKYTFQFQRCYSWDAYGREQNERRQSFVMFRACPQGSCSSTCKNGAEYIVEMRDFVESYLEAKQNLQEYNCQLVEENCNCDYDDAVDDDDVCLAQCYEDAGLDYCQQDEDENNGNGNANNFDAGEYDDCKELELNDDDATSYYATMYCTSTGKSIHLGVFTDEECTVTDESNMYYKTYGYNLPYSSKSIVGNNCMSCMNPFYEAGDDDGNQNDEDMVNEMCMNLYDMSGKCETDLAVDYPTTDACDYIHNVVPSLEKLFKGEKSFNGWTWFFGVTSFALLGTVIYLVRASKPSSTINLADQGGVLT